MKMSDLIRVCKAACPAEIAWTPGEYYGEYNIDDYNKTVTKVLYCVTATRDVVAYFKKNGYDLLITHHPFRENVPQLIMHTALDCCEGGLNDQWRDHLELKAPYKHFDGTLGWHGEITPTPFDELCKKVAQFTASKTIEGEMYCADPKKLIKTVVICSGLGGMVNELAVATGADCYILGEATMPGKKTGFKAMIETGHTNSEWMGVLLFRRILKGVQVDGAPKEIDYFGHEKIGCPRRRYTDRIIDSYEPFYDDDFTYNKDDDLKLVKKNDVFVLEKPKKRIG